MNDIKPDYVIDLGDLADMESLCSYDKGTKGFEGRRYVKDVAAAVDARERMYTETRKSKRKLPKFINCLGNHENRINRAINSDPVLEGLISTKDLQAKEHGWEEHPFLDVVNVEGVHFSHYFTSGVMSRPISSKTAARQLIMEKGVSCVMGHTHIFDYSIAPDINGKFRHGLVAGVYQDYDAAFAGPANRMWRRGVAVLHDVEDGDYNLQWISLDKIRNEYGR